MSSYTGSQDIPEKEVLSKFSEIFSQYNLLKQNNGWGVYNFEDPAILRGVSGLQWVSS